MEAIKIGDTCKIYPTREITNTIVCKSVRTRITIKEKEISHEYFLQHIDADKFIDEIRKSNFIDKEFYEDQSKALKTILYPNKELLNVGIEPNSWYEYKIGHADTYLDDDHKKWRVQIWISLRAFPGAAAWLRNKEVTAFITSIAREPVIILTFMIPYKD